MKDLETLAGVVSDAAIKAARKVSEPLDAKIKSIGRSIKSIDRLSREAVERSDAARADVGRGTEALEKDLKREAAARSAEIAELKGEFATYASSFSAVVKGLSAAQKQIRGDIADLPEKDAPDEELISLKKNFRRYRETLDKAFEQIAGVQERIDDIARQIPDPDASDIEELRETYEKKIGVLVDDFVSLKSAYDAQLEIVEQQQEQSVIKGAEAMARIDEIEKAAREAAEFAAKADKAAEELREAQLKYDSRLEGVDEGQKAFLESGREAVDRLEGLQEEVREAAAKAGKGDTGEPGSPGQRGPKGEPGSMHSPERWSKEELYKAGNTVLHRGGTWYSELTTVDEPGDSPAWTCLANGVDAAESYFEDGMLIQVHSDGQRVEGRVMPKMHGVYQEGGRYLKHDYVTWNGSLYRSLVDDPSQHPGKKLPDGEQTQWACDVKRGPRGQKGPPGDPADAAAIVYAQFQKDYAEATAEISEYLGGMSL